MHKKNYFSILIIAVFLISSIYSISVFDTSVNTQKIDEEIDDNTIVNPIEPHYSSEGWSSGETVKSDIEFPTQMIDFDSLTSYENVVSKTFTWHEVNRRNCITNDGNNYWIYITYDETQNTPVVTIYCRIYCGGSGILTYEQRGYASDGTGSYTDIASGNLPVNSNYLDAQGYFYFYWTLTAESLSDTIDLKLWYYNVQNYWGVVEVYHVDEVETSFGPIVTLGLETDIFSFQKTTIENNIRSEYQYTSDTVVMHKLTIPSVSYAKEVNIYAPTHWTYSSINPSASVSSVGSDYTIASPTELTYTVLFTSTHNYFLALEDVTSDYLTDIGFETGDYQNDWFDIYGQITTEEIVTDISSEGYHSLKISDTDGNFYLSSKDIVAKLPIDYYYVSFDVYVESSDNSIFFKYYTGSVWTNTDYFYEHTVDSLSRWNKKFFCIEPHVIGDVGTGQRNVAIYLAGTSVFYLDNFRVFKPSTQIETTDLDEYSISSTFINWDGYQNPTVSNRETYLELFDRTETSWFVLNEPIFQELIITDPNGVATYIYEGSLSQKEYEIRAFAVESTFVEYNTYDLNAQANDLAEWNSIAGISSYSESYDSDTDLLTFDITTSADYAYLGMDGLSYLEYNQLHYCLYLEFMTNDTDVVISSTYSYETGSLYFIDTTDYESLTTEYTPLIYNFDKFDVDGTLPFGDYTSAQNRWCFSNTIGDYAIYFRNFKFIHYVNFYFTPSYPYNIDYPEKELNNEWDFSEGDLDGYYVAYGCAYTVENGFLTWDSPSTKAYAYLSRTDIEDIDYLSFNYVICRIKVNVSGLSVLARWSRTPDSAIVGYTLGSTNGDWQTFSTSLSGVNYWDDSTYHYENSFGIIINTESNAIKIDVDFLRLVHVEEVETYNTNTWLGIGSENDAWISAVYSDNVFLGFYSDPNVIPLNLTNGFHNISWLPVARQQEQKAFIYNDLHTYTYQVSDPANYYILLNPPSFDVAAGLIYIDLVTAWGNCTYRLAMNSTFLGSAVQEGSSVWSCDFSSPGFYNFTLYVYQGEDVWGVLTTSITIPANDPPAELTLLFLTKDVDTSVSRIFVNYYTNWQNTSLIVFDNTTQLGAELFGEGASIWSFAAMDYYGYHNISICIYHASILQFVYYFSFTIVAPLPDPPGVLEILVWNKDLDVANGLIFVNVITNFQNCTVRVAINGTNWLGDYAAEGASIWLFTPEYAFFNVSIHLYYDSVEIFVEYFSFSIQAPSTAIYMVHFDLFTRFGVGLPFETVKIYVNNSRIYYPEQYFFAGSFLEIEARDYYNNVLYETNATITDNTDIALMLNLVGQHIKNKYAIPVEVYFFSTIDSNYNHSYILAAESEITLMMFCTSYHVKVIPLQETFSNNTHIITYFTTTSNFQDIDAEKKIYEITMDTELEQLNFVEPEEVHRAVVVAFILSAVLNAGLIAMIGAFIKWGFVKVWNVLLKYPNVALNWLLALFGVRPVSLMLEHKGGIEFVTPEEHQDIEKKKKEGYM